MRIDVIKKYDRLENVQIFFFFEKLIEKKMVIENNSLQYGRNHHFLEKKNLIGRFYTFGYH